MSTIWGDFSLISTSMSTPVESRFGDCWIASTRPAQTDPMQPVTAAKSCHSMLELGGSAKRHLLSRRARCGVDPKLNRWEFA